MTDSTVSPGGQKEVAFGDIVECGYDTEFATVALIPKLVPTEGLILDGDIGPWVGLLLLPGMFKQFNNNKFCFLLDFSLASKALSFSIA